jgi:hypothetical protein
MGLPLVVNDENHKMKKIPINQMEIPWKETS